MKKVTRIQHHIRDVGRFWVQNLAQRMAILIKVSYGFPLSLQAHSGILQAMNPEDLDLSTLTSGDCVSHICDTPMQQTTCPPMQKLEK